MAGFYGDFSSRHVEQARVVCSTGAWTALQVGSAPKARRRHLEIQVKGKRGMALALQYVNVAISETGVRSFTAPTNNAANIKSAIVVSGGTFRVFPLSDDVTLYGRMIAKAGASESSVQVALAEHG